MSRVSRMDDVGEADGWRCWLCDEPVDPNMSVNDPRGPSIDAMVTKAKSSKGHESPVGSERLAHRSCNTRKGAVIPVVRWPDHLFVADPAVILASVERLGRKGGREVMARCPTAGDARAAGDWLADRLSRLCPRMAVTIEVDQGGGQHLVVLKV